MTIARTRRSAPMRSIPTPYSPRSHRSISTAEDQRAHVQIEDSVDFLDRHFVPCTDPGGARIVDQQIKSAEFLNSFRDHSIRCGVIAHIRDEREDLVRMGVGESLQSIGPARHGKDLPALIRQLYGGFPADAAAGSGDYRVLVHGFFHADWRRQDVLHRAGICQTLHPR